MVCEQFDRCYGILLQYVEFLCSSVSPTTAYAELTPSLSDLLHLYHLDPEAAFLIFRPVMRLFKCESRSVSWPMCGVDKGMAKELEPMVLVHWFWMWALKNMGDGLIFLIQSELRYPQKSKAWNSLSPDLYATFWGLTFYDLYVPRNRYESEIVKQHAALNVLDELSDNSSSAIVKRNKEKERIQETFV